MGIDITSYTEVHRAGCWECVHKSWPFYDRNTTLFAFLGHDIAKRWAAQSYVIPQISPPRGLPTDLSPEVRAESDRLADGAFYSSWLTLDELLNFDYDQLMVTRSAAPEHRVLHVPLREELGDSLQARLDALRDEFGAQGEVRIVYWFDQS